MNSYCLLLNPRIFIKPFVTIENSNKLSGLKAPLHPTQFLSAAVQDDLEAECLKGGKNAWLYMRLLPGSWQSTVVPCTIILIKGVGAGIDVRIHTVIVLQLFFWATLCISHWKSGDWVLPHVPCRYRGRFSPGVQVSLALPTCNLSLITNMLRQCDI